MRGPMRCFLCVTTVWLVASATAADERPIVGKYKCVGDAGNGAQYEGTVEITAAKDTFRITWDIKGARSEGLALRDGDALSVAIRNDAKSPAAGLAAYRIKEDGSLAGRWSYFGWEGRVLTETWKPEAVAETRPVETPAPTASPTSADADQQTEKEWRKLEGRWALVAQWERGEPVEGAKERKEEMEFKDLKGEKWVIWSVNGQMSGIPFSVNIWPEDEPKGLSTWTELDDESHLSGIYKIEGDTLTYAYGEARPRDFDTSKPWQTVCVYRRLRDPGPTRAEGEPPATNPADASTDKAGSDKSGSAKNTGSGGAKMP